MINIVVYSKDRAQILRLLLESAVKNIKGDFNVNVLYTYTNSNFEKGYEQLKSESNFNFVNWVKEIDFKKQNIQLIDSNSEFTCLLSDDDVFYKEVDCEKIINCMKNNDDIFCFSLRLGKNTLIPSSTSDYKSAKNILITLTEENDIITWNWTRHYLDFAFPLSINAHIYHTQDILKFAKKASYNYPLLFEESIQIFNTFPKELMASFTHSRVVNQLKHKLIEKYNDNYLSNKIIDYDQIDFSNIKSCQQELNYYHINAIQSF